MKLCLLKQYSLSDFYNAVYAIKPSVVAISVSNYFHLVAAKRMIEELKKAVDYDLKIVVGDTRL